MIACPPNGRGFTSDGRNAMEPPEVKTSDIQGGGTPFQYSLRTMFIVMTVLAVALSGIYAGPPWASILTGLALGLLAPMVLTIGIIYGRGYTRTFCIGGLFPAGVILIALIPAYVDFVPDGVVRPSYPPSDETPWRVALTIFVAGAMILVSSLVAVGIRWMIEAPQRRREREAFLLQQILRRQAGQTSGPTTPSPPES
jgi:hypothetical protein